jgi:hypothetical protein
MKSPPYPTNKEIEARFVWGLLEIKQEKNNMKTSSYADLSEKQQSELLELEIKKQLALSVCFDVFTNDKLSQYPREAVPYILHHTSESFREIIAKRAINELEKNQYLPVGRDSNLTIIYTNQERLSPRNYALIQAAIERGE